MVNTFLLAHFWLWVSIHVQSNLSIPNTLGPSKTVLIIEVSLIQRFIYIVSGTTVNCPYYRGVQFWSVHNSRFDCTCTMELWPSLTACVIFSCKNILKGRFAPGTSPTNRSIVKVLLISCLSCLTIYNRGST